MKLPVMDIRWLRCTEGVLMGRLVSPMVITMVGGLDADMKGQGQEINVNIDIKGRDFHL